MADINKKAQIEVTVKGSEQAKAQLSGIAGSMKSLGMAAAGIFGAVAIGRTLGKVFKDAYVFSERQNQALRKLDNTIYQTGNSANYTSKELQELATNLQRASNFGDEEILLNVTTGLLRYSGVSKDIFPKVQKLIIDTAAETGDLAGTTKLLGIAMDDPLIGMTRLRRAGVSLSETQKEQIKQYVETNDKISAQTVLLNALETKFGGNAAAMQTATQTLKNSWGDYLEFLGNKTSSTLNGLQFGFAFAFNAMSKTTNNFTISQIEASLNSERAWSQFVSRFVIIIKGMGTAVYLVAKSSIDIMASLYRSFDAFRIENLLKPKETFNRIKNIFKDVGGAVENSFLSFKDLWVNSINQMSDAGTDADRLYNERIKMANRLKKENEKLDLTGISDGNTISLNNQAEAAKALQDAIKSLTDEISAYSSETLDSANSGNAMFDELNANYKKWADLRAKIKAQFGDTADATPLITTADEAFVTANLEIYSKHYKSAMDIVRGSVMSETQIIEAEYQKRLTDFDAYAQNIRIALDGLFVNKVMSEQEYNAELMQLTTLGTQIQAMALDERAKKLQEYNDKHAAVVTEAAIKELSAMEQLGQDLQDTVVNGFSSAFASALVDGDNFAKSMQKLFKDMVRMILAELAKLAILNLFTGGTAGAGGLFAGLFGGSRVLANTTTIQQSNQSYLTPIVNTRSIEARIDRLAAAVENNKPIVYTQVIDGVPFANAVDRAYLKRNAL